MPVYLFNLSYSWDLDWHNFNVLVIFFSCFLIKEWMYLLGKQLLDSQTIRGVIKQQSNSSVTVIFVFFFLLVRNNKPSINTCDWAEIPVNEMWIDSANFVKVWETLVCITCDWTVKACLKAGEVLKVFQNHQVWCKEDNHPKSKMAVVALPPKSQPKSPNFWNRFCDCSSQSYSSMCNDTKRTTQITACRYSSDVSWLVRLTYRRAFSTRSNIRSNMWLQNVSYIYMAHLITCKLNVLTIKDKIDDWQF